MSQAYPLNIAVDDRHESLLRLTARLYHVDGLSQTEISALIGVSRPQVSRLLARALNEGIVRILVDEYDPRNRSLEEQLKNRFNLNNALVIKFWGETDIESIRSTIGYLAAPYVAEWIFSGAIIGMSGSRSLYRLVQHIKPPSGTRGVTAVQLMGNVGASISEFDSIELCRTLVGSYGGMYYVLNAPALVPDVESRKIFMSHQDLVTIWKLYSTMNIAFVGIGSLTQSSFIERGVIGADGVEQLRQSGAVGEVCGRFYDRFGRECETEYQERVIGINVDLLREIREVIAVTCGAGRAEAIHAALNGCLVKSLVIDEAGAEAVLDRVKVAADLVSLP
jgi:deoxyribonucleoside regulator